MCIRDSLFGARYEEDILYRDELKAWAEANPGCRYEVTLSQGASSWTGRRGYVQVHVPELWRALCDRTSPAEPHVYVCGLERMVQVVRGLARGELGVGRKAIHTERYD